MMSHMEALTLGQIIRNARKEKGLSQAKLAEQLGCERFRIITWEKDRHRPGERYQSLLVTALGLPRSVFYSKTPLEKRIEAIEARLDAHAERQCA